MTRWLLATSLLVTALLAMGCDNDHPPWRVERPRALALRVEVVGDASRATPRPGETARVRVLVVDPAAIGQREWAFAICAAGAPRRGITECASPPFFVAEGAGEVMFDFIAPALDGLDSRGRVLIAGVVCTDGTLDEQAQCSGPEEERVIAELTIDDGTRTNHHPPLDPTLMLDGEAWPSECFAAAGPVALVEWRPSPDAREQVGDGVESLLLSSVVTAGDLDRYYTLVDSDVVTLEYEPPEIADSDAELILVLRDPRGGVSWIRRSFCVH